MKPWREAASLIIAATTHGKILNQKIQSLPCYNYNLLGLKRHRNSSFMPRNIVFPGGMTEQADAALKWKNLFQNFGFNDNSFSSFFIRNSETRSEILPREISLRITAIRETFEECGLLICRVAPTKNSDAPKWAEHFEMAPQELEIWQQKVHNDATQFYLMCEEFKCYPDLWSLYEWSEWLTPPFITPRFYTTFFISCMPSLPSTKYETQEIEDLKWGSPMDLLLHSADNLAPPQLYEISKISHFSTLENLLYFAVGQNSVALNLYMPVRVKLTDGIVYLLPGDSMYPRNVNLTENKTLEILHTSIEKYRNEAIVKNRVEFIDGNQVVINDHFDIIKTSST